MMSVLIRVTVLFLTISMASEALASEPLNPGATKQLSYRGGYITFLVVDSNNQNLCAPCPLDPGAMRTEACWIPEANEAQVGMLLVAYSSGQMIRGRVSGLTTDCNVYQMTVID